MRNNRSPQIYDLNVNIITENDVTYLAEEFKFNVTFDLLGKLRIFIVKLVDEIEEARQSPSKAEMKKDLKRLEHLFDQQLNICIEEKEILDTIPNFTRSYLYREPSSSVDFFQILGDLGLKINSLQKLKMACNDALEGLIEVDSLKKANIKIAAINLPKILPNLYEIFVHGTYLKPSCYVDTGHSESGYNGNFYNFVIILNRLLICSNEEFSLGAPSTIGDAICAFIKTV